MKDIQHQPHVVEPKVIYADDIDIRSTVYGFVRDVINMNSYQKAVSYGDISNLLLENNKITDIVSNYVGYQADILFIWGPSQSRFLDHPQMSIVGVTCEYPICYRYYESFKTWFSITDSDLISEEIFDDFKASTGITKRASIGSVRALEHFKAPYWRPNC